jgi:hypothetical protein
MSSSLPGAMDQLGTVGLANYWSKRPVKVEQCLK